MEIINKKVDELIPYANNPRVNDHAVPAVARSIEEFGFKVPVVIDRDNVIVAGHTRIKAAKQLGLETVPCIVADDLTPDQIRAFRLADNKTGELADWDSSMLQIELGDLLAVGFELELVDFGFDVGSAVKLEVEEDDYTEVLPSEPRTKYGDMYRLGRHFLLCGDSTETDSVNRLMGTARVDLFITDPPYNVDYVGKTEDSLTIANDSMSDGEYRDFLVEAFAAADSVMKPGACFYIWHADTTSYIVRGACNDVGWPVRQCLIWNKNAMVLGRQDYHWKHEPCLYGWKPGGGHLWASDRRQTTMLEFDRPTRSKDHPTMKPVRMFDYQVQNNTKKGDIVLDSFGGSGTTLIACEQNGRTCYMMELDPRYVDVVVARWETLTGQQAVLLDRDGGDA